MLSVVTVDPKSSTPISQRFACLVSAPEAREEIAPPQPFVTRVLGLQMGAEGGRPYDCARLSPYDERGGEAGSPCTGVVLGVAGGEPH